MKETLCREITEAFGVPGFEDDIRSVIRKHLNGLVDEVYTDNLGSLIGKKEGQNPDNRLLFAAHMDECGFMVKSVSKEGFIRFLPLGGWNPQTILGQRVIVRGRKGDVIGVVGAKPPHEMKEEEKKKAIELDDLWIDLGVSENFNPVEENNIRPGDPIVPYGELQKSANPKIWLARNWDNRSGVVSLLSILQGLKGMVPPCTVYAAFSVQEEVGLRGAATLPWKVNPDLAVALDVSLAEDTPAQKSDSQAKLGAGVGIIMHDVGMIPHLKFRDALIDIARQNDIRHHLTTIRGGYDTGRIHLYQKGVPSGNLGIPSRYIHGFASMIHEDDLECNSSLALALVNQCTPEFISRVKTFS